MRKVNELPQKLAAQCYGPAIRMCIYILLRECVVFICL